MQLMGCCGCCSVQPPLHLRFSCGLSLHGTLGFLQLIVITAAVSWPGLYCRGSPVLLPCTTSSLLLLLPLLLWPWAGQLMLLLVLAPTLEKA